MHTLELVIMVIDLVMKNFKLNNLMLLHYFTDCIRKLEPGVDGLHLDAYEAVSFKLGLMQNMTELYSLTRV